MSTLHVSDKQRDMLKAGLKTEQCVKSLSEKMRLMRLADRGLVKRLWLSPRGHYYRTTKKGRALLRGRRA